MTGSFKFDVKRNGKPTAKPSDALSSAVRKLGVYDQRKVSDLAARGLEEFLDRIGNTMRRKHGRAWPGGTGAATLSKRSGRGLAALTRGKVERQAKSIAAVLTLPRYLAHQEFGVVSTAKGKFLTVPLPAALNADGTPKKRSARGWQNTFVVQGKRGHWVICTKRGRRVIALYLLKPTIRIRPRLGLRRAMRTEMKVFKSALGKRITQLLKEA